MKRSIALLKYLSEDNNILFVGDSLEASSQNYWTRIGKVLSEKYDIVGSGYSNSELAQIAQQKTNRNALLAVLQKIAPLPINTKFLDGVVKALEPTQVVPFTYCPNTIIHLQKLGFRPTSSMGTSIGRERNLLRLLGDLTLPEELKITEEDLWRVTRTDIFRTVKSICTLMNPVFLGVDFRDRSLRQVCMAVVDSDDTLKRDPYFINCLFDASFLAQATGANGKILDHVIESDLTSLVMDKKRSLLPVSDPSPTTSVTSKGVLLFGSFTAADARYFHGRDDLIHQSFDLLGQSISIIAGESGSGKTSLLHAGVTPAFEAANVHSKIVRVSEVSTPEFEEYLDSIDDASDVALFVDQAEEFFTTLSSKGALDHLFNHLLHFQAIYPRLRILFTARDDFLSALIFLLKQFDCDSPKLLLVPQLTKSSSMDILKKICRANDIHTDTDDLKEIVDGISGGNDWVYPPYVQLIMDHIVKHGDSKLTADSAARIVETYVMERIEGLESDLQDVAKAVLASLVNKNLTKRTLPIDTLKLNLRHRGILSTVVDQAVQFLLESRIIRVWEQDRISQVELVHESIIRSSLLWVSEDQVQVQRAQYFVNQELTLSFEADGQIISRDRFVFIDYRALDLSWTRDDLINAFKVSTHYEVNINFWRDKLREQLPRDAIITYLEGLVRRGSKWQSHNAALVLLSDFSQSVNNELERLFFDRCSPNSVMLARTLNANSGLISRIDRAWKSRFKSWMKVVPSGPFLMGSSEEEIEDLFTQESIPKIWIQQEAPIHNVELDEYQIDTFPVTNDLYSEFDRSHTFEDGMGDHPAVDVDFFDAQAFARWCEKDLPSEAEWERAARGTNARRYPWGNEPYRANEGYGNCEDEGIVSTTPVGLFPRGVSPVGCLDMAGNVFEWTKSVALPYPFRDVVVSKKSDKPVLRGGAWSYNYQLMRCALRYSYYDATKKSSSIGFRCVSR